MVRLLSQLKCRECGKWIENTASGDYSTCPDMHGMLKQKLSKAELLLVEMAKLPEATQLLRTKKNGRKVRVPGVYMLAGHGDKRFKIKRRDISPRTAAIRASLGLHVASRDNTWISEFQEVPVQT